MSQTSSRRLFQESSLAFRQTITALLAWLIGYPLTFLIPRNPRLTVVIGRHGAVFADNSKYFFIYASHIRRNDENIVFLSSDAGIVKQIEAAGAHASRHPSLRSLLLVLRCGHIVIDWADWFDFGVYQLSRGAKITQLWHGAPLKIIELDYYQQRKNRLTTWVRGLLVLQKTVLGRYPVYDVVVATSQEFIERAFSSSFKAKRFLATGYPRNDILLRQEESGSMAERLVKINIDHTAIETAKQTHTQDRKVAIYVPTFRGTMKSPFDEALDLESLDAFAGQHKLLVVLKLHPLMRKHDDATRYANIIECDPLSDSYPLLSHCDLLITDYSSIYLDFLLLDRPIVFFAYDLDQYIKHDRSLYFDYRDMTPGAICQTQSDLEQALSHILANGCRDKFAQQRNNLCRFTHDHQEPGATSRLLSQLDKPG
jgi:CDP-glycerol glycerophosphotransferase (TagB/SpsB family)